ncbi:hypothetical protein ABZ719_33185 [Streptomyces sp. NPDC006743]|uniref:hypothetical protein n=1 Tax=Streptomyces sp. NPDC006743 TaxID=3154480 RepID=UPI00345146EF
MAAGAGALVASVVAYRRQRVDEGGVHREATRLYTERFPQAVEQLGSDSAGGPVDHAYPGGELSVGSLAGGPQRRQW